MLPDSTRMTPREFMRDIGLPCLVYTVIFMGASEIIESLFYNKVSDTVIQLLHIVRGVSSALFVAAIVAWSLARVKRSFKNEMDSVTSLLNLARYGLIALDPEFQLVSMNLRASELLGSIYSSNFSEWLKLVSGKIQSGQDSFECQNPLDQLHMKILSLQSPERGYLLLLQDITQEKSLEEQFIIAEKMSAFGRIAGGLAHETGTPLNIISGRAEIIQSIPDSLCPLCSERVKPSIDKHISVIFQQIERISGIIHQLLAQTKEEDQTAKSYSINDCVNQVLELVKTDLNREGVRLELALSQDLPELYGFPEQIRHVLLHLIYNAIDAVKGKEGVVEIASLRRNGNALVSVRDNGIGISRENLTRIFDPFFTTKEFGKGTGLGLSVASTLIHGQGGKIDVESQTGQGSRFVVTLPLK